MREGVLLPSLHRPLSTPTALLPPARLRGPLSGHLRQKPKVGKSDHPEKVHQDVLNTVSVVVNDDFNLQSRRILNLHEIKNYIIYVSGNGKCSVASSDPAL